MSKRVRYTVTASIATNEILAEYLTWIKNGHALALVTEGKALSAEINIVDISEGEPNIVEATYVFNSREDLQAYFDGPAVALKEDGKIRWVDTGKINFSRRIAEIDATY